MKDSKKCECGHHHKKMGKGGFYCLGVIGSAVYFIGGTATFWLGVLGFLKALVWPVFLVYGLMRFLGM